MILTLSCSVLAANQFYFDYIANGEMLDGDLAGFVLGGEYQIDSFKVGLDYLTGEIEEKVDYTQTIIKGGYGFTENISLTLSLLNGKIDEGFKFNGILLGGVLSYDIAENMVFEGALGMSVSGELKFEGETIDTDYTFYKLKFAYLFTENIGASFGYNSIKLKFEDGDSDINYMTLGATYKF